MTKAEKLLIISRSTRDLTYFLSTFFPHHFTKGFSIIHKELLENTLKFNRLAVAAPRKHGKSTIITFGYVMWKLLIDPNSHFVIIIANNYENAVRMLESVKYEFDNNKLIREIWGNLKSEKWSENEIVLKNEKKVIAGGNDFKIKGQKFLAYRPDLIILDDSEDDELLRSEDRRRYFEEWFWYALEPAMSIDRNQIIVIGTIAHRDCILSKLMEEGRYKDWKSFLYEAENSHRVGYDSAKAIWEEGVSLEFLLGEKTKDPHRYSREYLNNPVAYEHALFREEYFKYYKDEEIPKDLLINITVDLACTDKTYSDYTVIMPVGIDTVGDLWVLPYKREKYADPDKIIDEIFNMYDRYSNNEHWKFGKVGVEKVAFQRFLIKNLDRERKKRGKRFPIVELDAKGDKVTRISQLQPLFASGDIHIKDSYVDLKEELLDFPRAKHDDTADCLAYHLNFISHKPLKQILTDTNWRVTPEKQREKYLEKINAFKKPKVYCNF